MNKNVFSLNRSVAYLRRRASENRRQGRVGEAATLLRLAIESEFPPSPALLSDYSELLSSVGQYAASDELLYEMLQTADEEEQGACFYALGENAYARGEMQRAIDYLSLFLDGTCADEAYNHALDLLEDAQAAVCDPPIERGRGDDYAQRLLNHALDQLRDGYGVNAMRILRAREPGASRRGCGFAHGHLRHDAGGVEHGGRLLPACVEAQAGGRACAVHTRGRVRGAGGNEKGAVGAPSGAMQRKERAG